MFCPVTTSRLFSSCGEVTIWNCSAAGSLASGPILCRKNRQSNSFKPISEPSHRPTGSAIICVNSVAKAPDMLQRRLDGEEQWPWKIANKKQTNKHYLQMYFLLWLQSQVELRVPRSSELSLHRTTWVPAAKTTALLKPVDCVLCHNTSQQTLLTTSHQLPASEKHACVAETLAWQKFCGTKRQVSKGRWAPSILLVETRAQRMQGPLSGTSRSPIHSTLLYKYYDTRQYHAISANRSGRPFASSSMWSRL